MSVKKFEDNAVIAYNRRFYDFVPEIKEALKKNKLLSIELNFPEAMGNLIKKYGESIRENILTYMTSHWLDLAMFLVGKIHVKNIYKNCSAEGHIKAYNGLLLSENNVPIHLQINFDAPSNTSITFNFENLVYKLCPIETLKIYTKLKMIEPSAEFPLRRYIPEEERSVNADTKFKPGFLNQMKNFIECFIIKSKKNVAGCTLQEALNVTELCEEISKRNGR